MLLQLSYKNSGGTTVYTEVTKSWKHQTDGLYRGARTLAILCFEAYIHIAFFAGPVVWPQQTVYFKFETKHIEEMIGFKISSLSCRHFVAKIGVLQKTLCLIDQVCSSRKPHPKKKRKSH